MTESSSLLDACIRGTHAFQVLLFREKGEGDPACFRAEGLTDDDLGLLVDAHRTLLEDAAAGKDASRRVEAIRSTRMELAKRLPVNAATAWLTKRAPEASADAARGIANLFQICLEIDRDGDALQQTFRALLKLGLPIHPGQLGLPTSDDDLYAMGETLAAESCECPFATDPAAWQIAGRKIEMWGEKLRGLIGPAEYAREVLSWGEVRKLAAKLKNLPPMKIAVLGHSFSSYEHWSTHAPFNGVAGAALKQLGVEVDMPRIGEGGMTAVRAKERYFAEVLDTKPDAVLFVMRMEGDDSRRAVAGMARELTKRGIKAWAPDRLFPTGTYPWSDDDPVKLREAVKGTGLALIEVGDLLDTHPRREEFLSLDAIHMTGIYHKIMGAQLLKFIAAAAPQIR